MANIKVRAKTRMYEYRGDVLTRLQPFLPSIPGFADKPGRVEFPRSLATWRVRKANKAAADLSRSVAAAPGEAERRFNGAHAWNAASPERVAVPSNVPPHRQATVDPSAAFATIERCKARQIEPMRLTLFNAAQSDPLGVLAHIRSERDYLLGQPQLPLFVV